jgi:hypothetical protein
MAARVRSDCRIVRVGAGTRTNDPERIRDGRYPLPTNVRTGASNAHLKSAREGHITVALTSRGRRQHHRLRGMSTRIRALVHEQELDASTVTFG